MAMMLASRVSWMSQRRRLLGPQQQICLHNEAHRLSIRVNRFTVSSSPNGQNRRLLSSSSSSSSSQHQQPTESGQNSYGQYQDAAGGGGENDPGEILSWLPTMIGRLLVTMASLHVISRHVVDPVLCEGPSMLPTVYPQGEIILVDRWTPRRYGLDGGPNGAQRAARARERQIQLEQEQTKKNKGTRTSSLIVPWHEPVTDVQEMQPTWSSFWHRCTTPVSVGDVVVVQHPDRKGTVCKRVLGLPGDLVTRQRGGLQVVPDGHLWLEGDNSLNSSDSRNLGPIPAELLVGRALFRVWPLRGNAMFERGGRPMPRKGQAFMGSTILPAGYDGEPVERVGSKSRKEHEGKSRRP